MERILLKVESTSDYDRLRDEVEQITSGEEPECHRRLGIANGRPGLTPSPISLVGSSAYVSQIIRGKCGVGRAMANKPGEYFAVGASLFFADPKGSFLNCEMVGDFVARSEGGAGLPRCRHD